MWAVVLQLAAMIKKTKLNKTLKSYLIILGHVILGLIILILTQRLKQPDWLNTSILVFTAFLLLNLTYCYILRLKKELKEFWTPRKLHYLIIGVLAGFLIAIIPTIIALVTGQSNSSDISLNPDLSISAIALTFIIVGWEELWFRGLFLNYCYRYLSAINLSLTMGLLFMLIHIFNPEIDLIRTRPTLFFAGASLTILYFYYQNIWLPIGLHLGNNFFGSIIETTKTDDHLFFGNEGYFNAIILGGLFLTFAVKMKINTATNQCIN